MNRSKQPAGQASRGAAAAAAAAAASIAASASSSKTSGKRPSSTAATSASVSLAAVAAASAIASTATPKMAANRTDGAPHAAAELEELNAALGALAAVFPNVRPEVFREMLTTLGRESRAQVVAEHLLRSGGDGWVRGRWRVQELDTRGSRILREVRDLEEQNGRKTGKRREGILGGRATRDRLDEAGRREDEVVAEDRTEKPQQPAFLEIQREEEDEAQVPLEETFRTYSYRAAASTALRSEFRSLSRSTISGVLAEQNHCYTLARPILTDLAAKTWRTSIGNFVMRAFGFGTGSGKSKHAPPADESHYMVHWSPGPMDDKTLRTPSLRPTGDSELDRELELTVLEPILRRRRDRENKISLELALLLNEHEAELAGAMFECQVCFSDVAFEQMVVCSGSTDGHVVCFECIQRSVSEALYGQSWGMTVDHDRGQLACLAPIETPCDGCIPRALAERAVVSAKAGTKVWDQFQRRLADEAYSRSGIPLVKCPFCSYAEIDMLLLPSPVTWTISLSNPLRTLLLLLLALATAVLVSIAILLPFAVAYILLSPLTSFKVTPSTCIFRFRKIWQASLAANVRATHLPQRFTCRSPSCGRSSCLDCSKAWKDPHRCHESAALSLRTTVEAARTAALKRTCPRCGVSFVKASGCNKMVCVCGYAMCYVCREGINSRGGANIDGDGVPADGEEGYRHFCQHFRPSGGRCLECDRCDLYRADDEDELVNRAGARAEADWRRSNGFADDDSLPAVEFGANNAASCVLQPKSHWHSLRKLTLQKAVDWWVVRVLVSRLKKV